MTCFIHVYEDFAYPESHHLEEKIVDIFENRDMASLIARRSNSDHHINDVTCIIKGVSESCNSYEKFNAATKKFTQE